MDNIKLITILSDYGIFCLERQEKVLAAYRKIQREYWELAIVILLTLVAIACAIASIVCTTMELFDEWAAAITFILDCILIGMFVVCAKVIANNIHEAKTLIVEAGSVPTTLEDIAYIVNSLNGTEENEQ